MGGRFTGFPDEAFVFYEGLEADNSKAYWTDHREVYERCVKAPMLALVADLEPEYGPAKVFRPYRDVRFSRDKTPYKTAQGASLGGRYVQISAAGLFLGGGYYHAAPDQVERLRAAVADDATGPALQRVLGRLARAGWEIGGDRLKTRPRGYPPDHPRIDLLRHRDLIASREAGQPAWLHTAEARERIAAEFRDLGPLLAWLDRHVGPPR